MNTTTRLTSPSMQVVQVALDNQPRRMWLLPGVLASLVLVVFISLAPAAFAQNVNLGTAADFGALAASTVTNTGNTVISGSVGVHAGSAITGFPPGLITPLTGSFHSADAVALQAQSDLTVAYNDAAGRSCDETIAGNELGGLTRPPGVYCLGEAGLTGMLTLDGPGVYIFKMGSTLTTASNSSVDLINGASACDVFWQVSSSATIGTGSDMAGTIMAQASVTMTTGASLTGGALARTGAVTLDGNDVSACGSGSIVVEKATVPSNAVGSFIFSGDASGSLSDGEQIIVDNLLPGSYSSTEDALAGWTLGGIRCDDANSSVNGATAHFNVEAGETVTCLFTNIQNNALLGTIIVEKQTVPNNSAQQFEFTGEASGMIGDGEVIVVGGLVEGTYTSTEIVPAGWGLTGIVCDDGNSNGDTGTATATFNVEAGEIVRCVFTNTQIAVIPTMNQFGLGLMALLMLGLGLVGFRRLI